VDASLRPAVDLLIGRLKEQQQAVIDTKKSINTICSAANEPPMFPESELRGESRGPSLSIQSDQFYGQPLATSIRDILEMRRMLKQGPASVNEIFEALEQGGFKFETKNEENSKRGLRISLTKNTAIFHKLPNGRFGLVDWYPNVKTQRSASPIYVAEDEVDAEGTRREEDA
jgi:hypothetical protein